MMNRIPKPVCDAVDSETAYPRRQDWRNMGRCDHFVQFYRSEEHLINCVAGFAADGIWKSERAIVIATLAHRNGLEQRLRESGVDLVSAIVTGQYLALDAEETLSKFMVDGMPDAARFDDVIGSLVRRATRSGRSLRAFGEMVALLWKDGNAAGAIALEELWNGLSREHPFQLFCAYPESCLTKTEDGLSADHICRTHSQVIPIEF